MVALTQHVSEDQSWLRVVYEVVGPIEGRRLPFGPIPGPELAECDPSESPEVRIAASEAVRGYAGIPIDGPVLWSIQRFDPASAAPAEGTVLTVDVQPAR